ncbi:multiple sugar transport system substrate-binding protein [Friedmanniella endophytica]|uniref:Multiple sugar transport system substrate-binding protein n=1 Tax=Microlunatus kandeliicorticis TaxID=1759536 RepID=A0A7W3IVR6_9ACTN|nr:ABC transporter substrate-binding protein [Microlunatus kandeliicorticis]MBA8796144.1 multiple sugar transport system substrate-binding protein [Microlunatus kandeliicorticis]
MSFVRPKRGVLVVAASLSAVLLAAACGGSGGSSSGSGGSGSGSAAAVDLTKQGPTEYWAGKDTSGNLAKLISQFNAQHPQGKVTFHELPDNADQQQQQMIQATTTKNPNMGVISMDVVWTAQFAANGYVVALPKDQFPTDKFLPATVSSATYFNKLYGYPASSDGGLLYYRKDLLQKAGISDPPTTWSQLMQDCDKIKAQAGNASLGCYAGQFQKYEGLTVNFAEAVNGAGAVIVGEDGKPNVNTDQAKQGWSQIVSMYQKGYIPKAAITWQEEQGRQAFQSGQLIFLRNWPYVYALASKDDGSSKIVGKFGVAPLPGLNGPGVSSLGGHNMAIAANAANKGTAADFIKFMTSEQTMKSNVLATSAAPTLTSLYTDSDITKKYPYMPILLKSIETAKPRPKAVDYTDVTLAIEDAGYSTLQGQQQVDQAFSTLQTKLQGLIK